MSSDPPVEVVASIEPAAVAESLVQGYSCDSRCGVILRFGQIVGDDPMTRYWLRAASQGRPVGVGAPEQWAHLIHTDDIGPAVLAALVAPAGIFNVGAAPVRKADLVQAYAKASGVAEVGFLGPVLRRMAGPRIETLTRSQRVCSDRFSSQTGWRPTRPVPAADWFDAARLELVSP